MDELQRRLLQRNRLRLVTELRVSELCEPLLRRGVFTRDMLEDIRSAGTRRDQARQLVIDLQTRGSLAFATFVACLEETGQAGLADLLREGCRKQKLEPVHISPVEMSKPVIQRENVAGMDLPYQTPSERVGDIRRVKEATDVGDVIEGNIRKNSDKVSSVYKCIFHLLVLSHRNHGLPCYLYNVTFFGLDQLADVVMTFVAYYKIAKAYLLEADPCGFCLIINNVEFQEHTNLSLRAGSDIDREKLQNRFKEFHFEVLVHENLTGKEIHTELQSLAAMDHSQLDCCVVVILSHGCKTRHIQLPGGVYGTDGLPIPVERVVSYFDGHHCPTLRGKPKLFFIQACGGEERDKGFAVDSAAMGSGDRGSSIQSDATPFNVPTGGHDQPDAVASLPTPSDVLVAYSTFPGFVSWRDKKMGTWYVETLDRVLAENAASEDLQNLLVMVSNEVAAKGIYKQIPGYFNFLRKRFFFNTT